MRKILILIPIVLFFSAFAEGQTPVPRVFVASMDDGFDTYVSAGLIKNNVPVLITADETAADYIIVGISARGPHKWYDTLFGASRDRFQGSLKMIKVSDRTVVWAGATGDKSLFWGSYKSGGPTKVANRLARQLLKEYFNGRLKA
jgi:hypothetical protein